MVARNYLIDERPDAVLNVIDGTNLERNLYLTTQLTEPGIPVVAALNMMDVVRKNGDKIDTEELSRRLGCRNVEISAIRGEGIMEAAIQAAQQTKTVPIGARVKSPAAVTAPIVQWRAAAIKKPDRILNFLRFCSIIDPAQYFGRKYYGCIRHKCI